MEDHELATPVEHGAGDSFRQPPSQGHIAPHWIEHVGGCRQRPQGLR